MGAIEATRPILALENSVTLALEQLTNGLTADHDYFFPERPDDPDMREGSYLWLFEESGALGFPRIGLEGEGRSWEKRAYFLNVALPGGRVLHDSGTAPPSSPFAADGKPSVFGAGPLTLQCLEPFRRWRLTCEGLARAGSVKDQIAGTLADNDRVPLRLEAEIQMETPAWVQDFSPHRLAALSESDMEDARIMGIGWRLEQLCRGEGELTLDGATRPLRLQGSRVKRQSVRPLDAFRGHCWQSALFPDGRGFGYIAYPATEQVPEFSAGFVYVDGAFHPARASRVPYIRRVIEDGEDVSLVLESALGCHAITGKTCLSTFSIHNPGMAAQGLTGFTLHQGGARYMWDGLAGIGMIERSATGRQMVEGYGGRSDA